MHLNIVADAYLPEIQDALEPYIYEVVGKSRWSCHQGVALKSVPASHRGSVSAEHGIGAAKTHALHYSKSQVSIALMQKIKEMFDPRGIMNPGKVLDHD